MIYFQLSVRPRFDSYEGDALGRYRVDALFANENPRDSLSHLANRLRDEGWEIIEITEAQSVFARGDIRACARLSTLYKQAEKEGFAYRLNWADGAVALSDAPAAPNHTRVSA
jgi:hypothetical protein